MRIGLTIECYGCKTPHERRAKKPRIGYPENHGFQCVRCESWVSCTISLIPGMKAGEVSISQRFLPSERVLRELHRSMLADQAKQKQAESP